MRKTQFNRQYYELKDYNKTLEIDVNTLKQEVESLMAKYKKEKKHRKAAEDVSNTTLVDLNKLRADHEKLAARTEKNIVTEREKVSFLEQRLETCLQSNTDLRSKLDHREEENKTLREQQHEQKTYDQELKKECAGLNDQMYRQNSPRMTFTGKLAKAEADLQNALRKIAEMERTQGELKADNRELTARFEESNDVNKEQEKLLSANAVSLDRYDRENAVLDNKVQDLESIVEDLRRSLNEQKIVHMNVARILQRTSARQKIKLRTS